MSISWDEPKTEMERLQQMAEDGSIMARKALDEGRVPVEPTLLTPRLFEGNKDLCFMCGKVILTQVFKGTGICCEDCRKDRDNDHEPWSGVIK